MKILDGRPRFSASDLANHLACRHLTALNLECVEGKRKLSHWRDAEVQALVARGKEHEAAYLEHLEGQGLEVRRLAGKDDDASFQRALEAMRACAPVIAQATLLADGWMGIADVLLRVDTPSGLGDWSYEVVDTKLARETKGGTALQLCLYSEMIAAIQGVLPERMYVVSPGHGFEPEEFRVLDYLAYHRHVKRRLEAALGEGGEARLVDGEEGATYPEPCAHCDICDWRFHCDGRRRADDHLSLVAGISRSQRLELVERGVETLAALAGMPLPMEPRPKRGARESYERVREQARVQFAGRETGERKLERLEPEEGRGLARLPVPSPGDVFLDFEGDRYVDDGGLEFLFGVVVPDERGELVYACRWARDRTEEKAAFEWLMDLVAARWAADPGMHVYHYGVYEPGTLKRLMGRYAAREEELDRLLRGERLIDLYAVVREGLRASVERYGLKEMEPFCGYERKLDLEEARKALRSTQHALEHGDPRSIDEETMGVVAAYNREDCEATKALRDWLEGLRAQEIAQGREIPRPELKPGDASDRTEEAKRKVDELAQALVRGISLEPGERSPAEQAQWLLAHVLDWHKREEKVAWWEYFHLRRDLTEEELFDERDAVVGLEYEGKEAEVAKSEVHRFRFPYQEVGLKAGDHLQDEKEHNHGTVFAIDSVAGHLDVKKKEWDGEHPAILYKDGTVPLGSLPGAMMRLGQWVLEHGLDAEGPYRAARDLLLRNAPRRPAASRPLREANEDSLEAAKRVALELDGGVLPIQGPPGSGKTYTGGRMILKLVKEGKKVGVTALSHKAIRNLLEEVLEAVDEAGEDDPRILQCVKKDKLEENPRIPEQADSKKAEAAILAGEAQVAAGTVWLWARKDMSQAVDVLFVDEAGQLSLANVLAASQGATSVVLLGDPQQLEQPQRGAHPEDADVSALEHVLGENNDTIPEELGLFLETTFRMHPEVCAPISELFYREKLEAHESVEQVHVAGTDLLEKPGLVFVPVEHEGNRNASAEEVEVVCRLVEELTRPGVTWKDRHGNMQPLELEHVLVVAPYNAQVTDLQRALPDGAKVGTVDKFQGQEAPVVIYSLASSSPEEAPRGMEFLYSPNRLNVAVSRARCNAILVANPALFEPECKTPKQIRLANAFCRVMEQASALTLC